MNYPFSGTIPYAPPTDIHPAIHAVSRAFGVTIPDLMDENRGGSRAAEARYVTMFIMRTRYKMWLHEIASEFHRHHSSVVVAVKEVKKRMADCEIFSLMVKSVIN